MLKNAPSSLKKFIQMGTGFWQRLPFANWRQHLIISRSGSFFCTDNLLNIERPVFRLFQVLAVPNHVIARTFEKLGCKACHLLDCDYRDEILTSKNLVENRSHKMNILISNLHKDAAAFRKEVSTHSKSVS